MILEDQAFSPSYDLATPLHPLPPLASASSTGDTQEDRERETTSRREMGRGWGRSQIKRQQEILVLYV
jgi:hypothetical protein